MLPCCDSKAFPAQTFFSEVLLSQSNPIGKITYYALRIEFQMRGSPHLHALIWTSDCENVLPPNNCIELATSLRISIDYSHVKVNTANTNCQLQMVN